MKTVLIVLFCLHLIDLWLMPVFGAKCRSGAALDKASTWLPFSALYKVLMVLELVLAAHVTSDPMILVCLLVFPYVFDWPAFRAWLAGNGTYTIIDPWTRTKQDMLELNEHRFYPVHDFNPRFFWDGILDNAFRYLADVAILAALLKTWLFL